MLCLLANCCNYSLDLVIMLMKLTYVNMAGNRKTLKTFTPQNRAKWTNVEIKEFLALSEEEEHLNGSDESGNDSDNISDERVYYFRIQLSLPHQLESPFLPCACMYVYIRNFYLKINFKIQTCLFT